MAYNLKYSIAAFIFLLNISLCAYAQQPAVKAATDKKQIIIGEPVELTLSATVPANAKITWFKTDTLPHFEIIDKPATDTTLSSNIKAFTQKIVITSFDSGQWSIPRLALQVNNQKLFTDSILITIAFAAFDEKQDYHDIKDIVEVEAKEYNYLQWIIGAAALLAIVLWLYFLYRSKLTKQTGTTKKIYTLPAFEQAVKQLKELQKQYNTNYNVKNYYSGMNDVLRHYLERKTNWPVMQQTNMQLVQTVRKTAVSATLVNNLMDVLNVTDAVKFAKWHPQKEDDAKSYEMVLSSIKAFEKYFNTKTPQA
jgi:hypothetical protein